LTAAARVGLGNPRSGQKKACGAVEQKKAAKQGRKKRRKKRLLLWPRLENRALFRPVIIQSAVVLTAVKDAARR